MRIRFFTALAAVLLSAAPLYAEPPKPTVVVQAKPLFRLLGDFREMIRQVGGPDEGEKMVKDFDNTIKEALGEKGFEGIDTNRPLATYGVLREDFKDSSLVIVVPVTGEKEFVGFIERIRLKAEPVKDKAGVYTLSFPGPIFPKTSHLQFANGNWAYVTLNGGDPADAKDLLTPADLFDNADQSLVSAKFFPGRVPEKLAKKTFDELDQVAASFKQLAGGGGGNPPHAIKLMNAFFDEGPKLLRRYTETGIKEAAEIGLKLNWDAMTGDIVTEITLSPKPDTPLAKEIAANATFPNRFAGLVPKDAVMGAVVKSPLFAKEIREIVAALLEAGQEEFKSDRGGLPREFHPIVDEVAKGFIGSVKKGNFDFGAALVGPEKGGKFTIVGGISIDDSVSVEKALRQIVKAPDLAKLIQLDAEKVGAVSIHKAALMNIFPERDRADFAKLFGADPSGYVAFDKDAVFVAIGPDALATIKAAIESKPGPAPFLDATANMKRLHSMVFAAGGERSAAEFAKMMGTDDKSVNVLRISVEGGAKLTGKVTFNVRVLPKILMPRQANATFKEVRPPK